MGLSELGEGHGRSPWAETKSSLMEENVAEGLVEG
ncbi:MAG: hypothetical protein KatS3mg123_1075 [Burkholderiales bacterium]|nr:MAG: hypothetical protein KatS3mg123_1075 [Burkholderiales bacterium]